MRRRPSVSGVLMILLPLACGLPRQEDMDLAQSVYDIGEVVQELQASQADLADRVDSLTRRLQVQDSLLRSLANLTGNPIPTR